MEDNQLNKGDCEVKKGGAVWSKKPLNEVVGVSVMGGDDDAWPSLDAGAKAALKSPSSDSLTGLSDSSLQVTGNSSSLLHKPEPVKNMNPATVTNHVAASVQKPAKRGGGSSGVYVSNGGVSKQLPASQELKVEVANNSTSGKPATVAVESHTKESAHKESPKGGTGSQPNSVNNDHHHQRNAYRRGNGGQHPRGDGSYHHNYAGKVDQNQGRDNQEWNQHRNYNNRYNNMQPQRGNNRRGGYMRPAVHNSAPFVHPPMPVPMRPFANNVMYPDVGPAMIYVQGPAPFVGPFPAPVYYSAPDPIALWHTNIVNQIEYYFSNENLVKDTYLRSKMDEQGWVSVSLIAGFKKVTALTNNVDVILDVMRHSTIVEVQDDKIRRRNDWKKWLMPPTVSGMTSRSLSQDSLTSQLQGIALDGATFKNEAHVESFSSRSSSSGEFSSQFQQVGGGDHRSSHHSGFERAAVV